ncbi:type II toxin-antitoxin system Phd/YefM family antitoxin [uncultured Devosia sp.]|uniref:type II toxin-antitoxin system Phd/YefM family antitoxin n=1 Tax=uncultured Devosia sp. TaxID=211434 RepID=UPI0035CC60AC
MSEITATDAKNKFGQMLEMAQAEPVRIQKNGRDVAILISPEQYGRLVALGGPVGVNPLVVKLHRESVKRWGKVYEALAK